MNNVDETANVDLLRRRQALPRLKGMLIFKGIDISKSDRWRFFLTVRARETRTEQNREVNWVHWVK